MQRIALICWILLLIPSGTMADAVYQSPTEFIAEAFQGKPPEREVIWITQALKPDVREILGHDLETLRVRFWREGQRTAWILNEIGKEKPITVGVVIRENRLERLEVLVFRESRGGEVRYPFFTRQFKGCRIDDRYRLDRPIDNISGATLSVRALTRIARLALYLHRQSRELHESS